MRFRTGNTVADILLNMKYHEGNRKIPGLRMDVEQLILPQELAIPSYDLGVILGNALDNAMEACRKLWEKDPEADIFIRLSSRKKGKLLILKVENSFDGILPARLRLPSVGKGPEQRLQTDPGEDGLHGIGLSNIQKTAEKYQGSMDFRVEGRVFILPVMVKG